MSRALICWVALLLAPSAYAQPPDVVEETQAWFALIAQKKLGDSNFVFWLDAHVRINGTGNQQTLIARPGLGYRFRPDMSVWVGYAWVPVFKDEVETLDEHRLWQQWTWDIALPLEGKIQLRSRLEERFAKGSVGFRFREFVRAQTGRLGNSPVMLVVWDEAFVAFNDTSFGQQVGFDQNRLFLGLAFYFSKEVRFEAGYGNQYVVRRDAPDPVRHLAVANLFANW